MSCCGRLMDIADTANFGVKAGDSLAHGNANGKLRNAASWPSPRLRRRGVQHRQMLSPAAGRTRQMNDFVPRRRRSLPETGPSDSESFIISERTHHVRHRRKALSARAESDARRHPIAVEAPGNVPAGSMADLFQIRQERRGHRPRRKTYLDMSYCGIGATILSFADPDVDAAVKAAIDMGSMSTLNCAGTSNSRNCWSNCTPGALIRDHPRTTRSSEMRGAQEVPRPNRKEPRSRRPLPMPTSRPWRTSVAHRHDRTAPTAERILASSTMPARCWTPTRVQYTP